MRDIKKRFGASKTRKEYERASSERRKNDNTRSLEDFSFCSKDIKVQSSQITPKKRTRYGKCGISTPMSVQRSLSNRNSELSISKPSHQRFRKKRNSQGILYS
jgi:hypothetical protein